MNQNGTEIIELINQFRQFDPDMINGICIINGGFFFLDQVEKMGYEEYSARSIQSMPKKLYKFFSDKPVDIKDDDGIIVGKENYSIKALESNEVYLSCPSDFDDVFDSEISVQKGEFIDFRIKTYARRCNCFDEKKDVTELKDRVVGIIDNWLQSGYDLKACLEKEEQNETEKAQVELFVLRLRLKLLNGALGEAFDSVLEDEYSDFVKGLRVKFRICCFTTNPMSQLMWGGSYGNEHKGFCVEYTVHQEDVYKDVLHNTKPVFYTKCRNTVSKSILEAYDRNWNSSSLRDLYMEGVLRKSIDWAYQNEWRLILPPNYYNQKGYTKEFFPITKVFLGNRMSVERRKVIIDICKRKGIPYAGVTRSLDRFEMQECDILCENCPNMALGL